MSVLCVPSWPQSSLLRPAETDFLPKTTLPTQDDSLSLDFFHIDFFLISQPGVRRPTFKQRHEQFKGDNWYALKIDPETFLSWRQTQAPVTFRALKAFGNWKLYLNGGITRDVEAWYRDEWGVNLPQNTEELNISSQPEAWVSYDDTYFHLQAGQFFPQFGPSPQRSVVISQLNLHRGVDASLRFQTRVFGSGSYRWFWSSLDSHLSEEEASIQATSLVSNARGRSYDALSKNLFAHRLEWNFAQLDLGLMETVIIGGKSPEFWEVQPFTVYHNNYPDGYGNTLLSLDFKYKWNTHHAFYGELGIDDFTGGQAENINNSSNILAWVLGYEYNRAISGGHIETRFEVVKVDAAYGNRDLPLLEFTGREAIRSNYRLPGDPVFADTYVVDMPLGYFRGPDFLDFWYHIRTYNRRASVTYEVGYLQKGSYNFESPFDQASNNPPGPVSPVFTEWRHRILGEYFAIPKVTLRAGLLWEIDEEHHFSGALGLRYQW